MRSFHATHNLVSVSANSKETAINTAQTLDTTMLCDLGDCINLVPRRESNADEATGYEEPDRVYDLGNKAEASLNFSKAQPQHFALLMAYGLGDPCVVAAGTGYEHTFRPIDGEQDDDRSNPSFTAAQRYGKTVLKRRYASMFVDGFSATFAADEWCKISGEIKGTGLVVDNITEESITEADDSTTLTLAANAVEGSTAAERLENVQRIRVELASGEWTEVAYSAVSSATPAVITITAPGTSGNDKTYKVLYIAAESGWMSLPARVTETPLRVAEMTLTAGGAWVDELTNGSMEADSNWSNEGTPSTQERSSTQAYAGTYSRKFIVDAAEEGIVSDAYTTVTGERYKVDAWVYPDDATNVHVEIRCGDDSDDVVDVNFTGLTQDAWNRISFSYAETAGGASATIAFHSGTTDAGTWYIDGASVCHFSGGREMDAEIKSVEWTFSNNGDCEFVPGAGDAYAARYYRGGRTQTIRVDREFREYIIQQHIDDNDEFGLHILCEGATYNSPHKYEVELVFPAVSVLSAPISVDGKRLAEAGDLLVLEDSTYGSVIASVKNLQSSYAA